TSCTTAPVTDTICAGTVPCHPHKQRAVVTKISRPPVLRIRHQSPQIRFQRFVIKFLELFRVIKSATQRVGFDGMLMQQINPQLVWPPITVSGPSASPMLGRRCSSIVMKWTLSGRLFFLAVRDGTHGSTP